MLDNINKTEVIQGGVETGEESMVKGKAEKKAGKRIGYNYIIIKSLKESQKNDVVKCFYIKSLFDFGVCVIKEGTYGDTMDKYGRDIKDRLLWQEELHEILQHEVRVPKLLGSFKENGNYYLVIERIKGKPLNKWLRENKGCLKASLLTGTTDGISYIGYLMQILMLLEKLHARHIIHRDVTANNFIIMPNGKVAVIDLELSYSTEKQYPNPPFQLGTRGYMSPEQEATLMPTEKEDLFSIGAIILQSWSGISPAKMTKSGIVDLKRKIDFFIPDRKVADITFQCLHPDPLQRPSLRSIYQTLEAYRADIKSKKKRSNTSPEPFSCQEIRDTVQQSIVTLGSPLLMDTQKGWFSESMNISPNQEKTRINKSWYASFSRGAAGILFFLSKAKQMGLDITPAQEGIRIGMELIAKKYNEGFNSSSPGLYYGSDGVAFALVDIMKCNLCEIPGVDCEWMKKLLRRPSDKPGFFYGLAGQGISMLKCSTYLDRTFLSSRLNAITDELIQTQTANGYWIYNKNAVPGFSHGAAGIIYYLLTFGKKFRHQQSLDAAIKGLNWLIKKSIFNKGEYHWKNIKGREATSRFCNGPIGIGLVFLKAFEVLLDPTYKKYAVAILSSLPQDNMYNNLSQCHGACGVGEIYMEAFRILREDFWMQRASHIAQLIMHLRIMHPSYGPYWITENEQQPVANFMVGNSGILHFLLRYCHPEIVEHPIL